jgi:2-keto-4-pentenoate hydratase
MPSGSVERAALLLWEHWMRSERLDALPPECRPADRADGYGIQAAVARLSGQRVIGWKIAATSAAGQRHIAVDGPLAGPLLEARAIPDGTAVPLDGNLMRVAEAEFAFRMAHALPPREAAYSVAEVMAAVGALHPAIEVPDSRYRDFTKVGASQLIADCACACWYRIGSAVQNDWRKDDLVQHVVTAERNGQPAGQGSGANVLGDPRLALTWIANELRTYGPGLSAGDVVITGTCLPPAAVSPGDHVRMNFGAYGVVDVSCA